MGWILFIDEDGKHCAWPDAVTRLSPDVTGEGIKLQCGNAGAMPAESPQHTNDFEQALMWVEEDIGGEEGVEDDEGQKSDEEL